MEKELNYYTSKSTFSTIKESLPSLPSFNLYSYFNGTLWMISYLALGLLMLGSLYLWKVFLFLNLVNYAINIMIWKCLFPNLGIIQIYGISFLSSLGIAMIFRIMKPLIMKRKKKNEEN